MSSDSNQLSVLLARFTFPGRGRRTSSPPQFGQIEFIDIEQSRQKVHSWTQM